MNLTNVANVTKRSVMDKFIFIRAKHRSSIWLMRRGRIISDFLTQPDKNNLINTHYIFIETVYKGCVIRIEKRNSTYPFLYSFISSISPFMNSRLTRSPKELETYGFPIKKIRKKYFIYLIKRKFRS